MTTRPANAGGSRDGSAVDAGLRLLAGPAPWAALLLVCIWGVFFVAAEQARERELAGGRESLRQLTFAIAQHTERAFRQQDQLVRVVREEYRRLGAAVPLADWRQRGIIDGGLTVLAGVIDAQGAWVASSLPLPRTPIDLSDREHFTVHRDAGRDELFIGKTVVGRPSGKAAIEITRRIEDRNGRFAGVAMVSTDPGYLIDVYKPLLPASGVIALTGLDGSTRILLSQSDTHYSREVREFDWFKHDFLHKASGFSRQQSALDGVWRVFAFQRVEGLPLVVSVGIGEEALLAGFDRTHTTLLVVSLVLSVVVLGTAAAVHKLRVTAVRLAAAEYAAARANREKTEFLATVSRELATPLHGIRGSAELLRLAAGSEEWRERAQRIFNDANHLLALVEQVREHATDDGRDRALKPHAHALRPLLERAVMGYQVAAGRKGLALALEVSPQAPGFLTCDATALLRVLGNLLDNAVKFTASGSVTVRAEPVAGGLRIEVRDSGPGIARPELAALFARRPDPRHRAGAGLGLALSQELAAQMGGTLTAHSRPGAGATFALTLPDGAPPEA